MIQIGLHCVDTRMNIGLKRFLGDFTGRKKGAAVHWTVSQNCHLDRHQKCKFKIKFHP